MAPLLADKNGIQISIYFKDHLPPHFHVTYAEDEALIEIRSGKIYKGWIPPKKLKIVQKWLKEGENRKRAEKIFFELNPRLKK